MAMGGAGRAMAGPFGPNDRAACTRGTSELSDRARRSEVRWRLTPPHQRLQRLHEIPAVNGN